MARGVSQRHCYEDDSACLDYVFEWHALLVSVSVAVAIARRAGLIGIILPS